LFSTLLSETKFSFVYRLDVQLKTPDPPEDYILSFRQVRAEAKTAGRTKREFSFRRVA
jgi:hypothetical protein